MYRKKLSENLSKSVICVQRLFRSEIILDHTGFQLIYILKEVQTLFTIFSSFTYLSVIQWFCFIDMNNAVRSVRDGVCLYHRFSPTHMVGYQKAEY